MLKRPEVWLCFMKEDQNKAKGDAGATDSTTNPTWCGENPDLNPVKWRIKVLPCNCSVVLSFKLFLKHLVSKSICRYEAGIEIGIVSKMSNDTHRIHATPVWCIEEKNRGQWQRLHGSAPLTAQKERSFYHSAFSANQTNCQAGCSSDTFRSCLRWGASARLWPIWPKPSSCSRRPVSTGTEGRCCSSPRSDHLKSFTCAGFWPRRLTLCSLCLPRQDYVAAMEDFQQSLELKKNQPIAMLYKGLTFFHRGMLKVRRHASSACRWFQLNILPIYTLNKVYTRGTI